MTREELAHVLRAASQIAKDNEIVVLGSQSILGSFAEDMLPEEATLSVEADIAFVNDPDETKSDLVDGVIGEESSFHEQYGSTDRACRSQTAVLPAGWEERVVPFRRPDADPSQAVCIDPHDLVISKLVAGREKDLTFAAALVRCELVYEEVLHERADLVDRPRAVQERVHGFIRRCATEAKES